MTCRPCSVCADRMCRVAALGVLLIGLAACGGPAETPQDRVVSLIDAMERAVEAGALKSASALLHVGYSDRWHPDRRAASRSLFGYMHRHSDIHLFTVVREVNVAPGDMAATAVVYVAMSGMPVKSVDSLVSIKADLFRFDVKLLDVDKEWRVKEASWERVALDAFGQ